MRAMLSGIFWVRELRTPPSECVRLNSAQSLALNFSLGSGFIPASAAAAAVAAAEPLAKELGESEPASS
eukprot:12356383-Alexandrium_andersonii.AAC.1